MQLQRKEQEEVTRKKEEAEEKERLVQLQRKEQEEATRKKEEAKEKERLVQLQRKEQEEVTRKKDETKEKEKLVQLQRKEQEEATRKKEEAKEKESQKQTFLLEPEMVFVKGGSFNRQYKYEGTEKFGFFGSSSKKVLKEGTQKVTLSDFSIGKYPITEAQWLAIMGYNSRNFLGCDNCPVVDVSWDDCQEFIKKLNEKTNKKYRLPTEAEWEFAARGGNQSKGYKYSGSDNLDEIGWYIRNSDGKTHPVGTKKANELGIYDMSGNVNEWCYDWEWSKYYGENYNTKDVIDPKGAEYGSSRVYRGGSRSNSEEYFSVYRVVFYSSFKPFVYYTSEVPGCSAIDIGFRVVLSP